jgi:tetratricopeptide (TPR) repeat protein
VPQATQQAVAAYQRGERSEAERLCRLLLDVTPDSFEALYLLGIIAEQTGRAEEAVVLLSKAAAVKPGIADAHYNLGVALGELKRTVEAVESYERAIALRSDYADAYFNRGVALAELDHPTEAVESYDRAIAIQPEYAEAYNNRGIALSRLQRYVEALASYEGAIAHKPDYARAYNNRGVALRDLERHAQALESYDRAIALRPDYPEAYNNRGIALAEVDRPEAALESYKRAVALKPDYAEAFYNLGNALRDLNRIKEAIDSYERAIALAPNYASAHWNLADCRLLLGDFALGWQEYEWRWKLAQNGNADRDFQQPLWLGAETLQGRTILLHSELGMGDTLLFCRYAKEVAALGAKVVLEVQPPLLPLLSDLEGVAQVVPRGAPLPAFDYHCPLMSTPLAFKTDLSNIPACIPYIHSDPALVAVWQAKMGDKTKPRVGLVWSGSMLLKSDKRSMTLADVLPLVRDWGEWVSLQKEVDESSTALLASRPDIRHLGGQLKDFADTAALVDLMDVVVTVDTSVAHVAGAMGKPVWILLPFNSHDWRWMLDREDSVWYPTARLFRQSSNRDWPSVINRVNEELIRHFDAPISGAISGKGSTEHG